ncbi:MAG: ECF transporter S component [Clostridiales bacterium]|nr:ECF transporter S component [Clostridiales bacterium]MDY3747346.1 ECF transporter S component [Lachnospiraceae bacterium]
MLKGESLDRFIDRFWENTDTEANTLDTTEEELAEYTLPSDGFLIAPVAKTKISRRTWISLAGFLVITPILLFILVSRYHGRQYLMFSLFIVLYAMIPFFMVFEGRKPQPREMMVISVLAAIGVAGRAAFYMIPNFKPIAAVVIITGVSFGGEAGFLVACIIMLVSNMFMGQGPWTPWQMFAYGMIGFLAGILFRKGVLKPKRISLCIYGFLSVFFIFGGIMNPASILMSYGYITKSSLIAYYISGAPVDFVHAASTVIFLWFMSKPMFEKLERIKKKYGLIER